MKVILIGNYKLLNTKSMFLYTDLLKKVLNENKVKVSEIYASPVLNKFFKNKFISKWLSYIDKYLIFGIKLIFKIKTNDLVHITDHSNSLLIPFIKSKKIIITCHDLINLKKMILNHNQLSFTGKIYQKMILNNIKKANIIICVSKNTQIELIKYGKINKKKTKFIYHTFNQNFSIFKKKQPEKFKYFFHVGDNKIYKNRLGVIEIFNELIKFKKFKNYKLILAGKKISEEIFDKISSYNLNKKIINIIDPNSNKLSNLYKNSEGLIFPSLEEGFGWPIIEAQSLGCVVYTTNKPPMNEIGGNACFYIHPESPKKSAKIIHNTYNSKSKINSLAKINLEKFEYNTFTKKYLDTYKLMNDL